jgi:RNA polymerase sigma-70 factor (ECF subfamily)
MIQDEYVNILINQCAKNDRIAQEKLYYLYYNSMKNVVRKYIDNEENAEEILNNGYLIIFKKINQYKFQGSFEGWMKKIMYRKACDFLHANKKKIKCYEFNDDILFEEKHSDTALYDKIIKIINELPSATAKIFKMFIIDEMKHAEISEMVGITESTSKWHVAQGRMFLQNKINKLQLI